jgi:AcrR family transcriptional regulator
MTDAAEPGRRQKVVAARPSTPSQHQRYERILLIATEMLRDGGEDALQMRNLSERACVSLATLYRYFPSKDHVMLAVAAYRFETAFVRIADRRYPGDTVRERVAYFLLRSFAREQDEPEFSTAMHKVLATSDPELTDMVAYVRAIIQSHLRVAAGPITKQQELVIPVVMDIAHTAVLDCLSSRVSTEYATMMILLGSRLIDLDEAVIEEDRTNAGTWAVAQESPGIRTGSGPPDGAGPRRVAGAGTEPPVATP